MSTPRVTRAQWGATPVDPNRPTRVGSMRGTGQHWVGPGIYGDGRLWDHSLCAGKVRGIQRAHMAGEYYDIAYNEVACPHGVRYEGRGYHVQPGANGSSFANQNWYAILALVGTGDPITRELLAALADAHEAYRDHGDAADDVTYHRHLLQTYAGRSTDCPGDTLIGHCRTGRFDHVEPTPAPTPAPTTTEEIDMRILVQLDGTDPVYISDLITRRWIQSGQELTDVRTELKRRGLSTDVQPVARMAPYGVLVGPDPEATVPAEPVGQVTA